MKVTFVVAMTRGLVIGRDGGLPWRLPRDLKNFRQLTWGKPIIMGRKTHESIGRALPGRLNIILSRGTSLRTPEVEAVRSVPEALERAARDGSNEAMIVGGSQVYEAFLPLCTTMNLTLVEGEIPGDAHFPFDPLGSPEWCVVHEEQWEPDAENPLAATYFVLERRSVPRDEGDARPHTPGA